LPDDPKIEELRGRVTRLEERVSALEGTGAEAKSQGNFESSFGLTFVNRAGAVTIAVGVVLFFKYAADSDWISASAGIFLAVLGGLLLIGAGEWLRRRNQSVFAQGVAGCGLAILFIAIYAAHAYYRLIGLAFAFTALALVGGLGLVLALRFGDGFLAPWNAFVWLVAAAALTPKEYPFVFVICAFLLAAAYGALNRHSSTTLYLVAQASFLAGAMRGLMLWSVPFTSPINRASVTNELFSIFLAVYALALIAIGVWRGSAVNRLLGLTLLGLVVAKLYLYDIWLLNRFYRISAFVALGVLLLAASYLYSHFRDKLPRYFAKR
jgi:uncharacterized membrane protein